MKKILALFTLLFLATACGGYNTKAKVDEVFELHDEVMPKMGEVMNLKRRVLEQAQNETDSARVNELRDLAKRLDDANTGMMVWMREWSKNADPHVNEETDIEARKAFFEQEMARVTKVKEDINNVISAAKEELK